MNDEHKNVTKFLYHDNIGRISLVQHWGTDETIVRAARVSFGQHKEIDELSDKDKKLIKYLIKHKHSSTLEHCGATFLFVVPLFVRSQHHRHRTWSYNEISRRYTDVDIKFYSPLTFRAQHTSNRQASNAEELINPNICWNRFGYPNDPDDVEVSEAFKMHHEQSLLLFNQLIEAGVCREQARGVLPQNMYTTYYGTVNLNNLLKFIKLRAHEGAQWEIQKVAEACLEIATDLWPVAVNSYRKVNNE
tara:strand:+ start:5832 stop:6572 length:741 start_codon:yes stop_codon:yes gene_type:complete